MIGSEADNSFVASDLCWSEDVSFEVGGPRVAHCTVVAIPAIHATAFLEAVRRSKRFSVVGSGDDDSLVGERWNFVSLEGGRGLMLYGRLLLVSWVSSWMTTVSLSSRSLSLVLWNTATDFVFVEILRFGWRILKVVSDDDFVISNANIVGVLSSSIAVLVNKKTNTTMRNHCWASCIVMFGLLYYSCRVYVAKSQQTTERMTSEKWVEFCISL